MTRPADIEIELAGGVSERASLEATLDRLAPLFDGPNERSALFVATPNAGVDTALRFWSEAIRLGVARASPEAFPWCLANAAGATLSRRFGVCGPNATWLGTDDARLAAWRAAERVITRGEVSRAFVVDVRFASRGLAGHLWAWRIERGSGSTQPRARDRGENGMHHPHER